MMILKFAWKNIWRNKLRSGVILFAITLGLYAGVFVAAFVNGMVNQFIESAISTEVTHLQVNQKSFLDMGDLQDAFAQQPLEDSVRALPQVEGVSPRVVINATVSTAYNMGNAQIIGIDPEKEKTVSRLYECIADSMGNYFADETKSNSIVVGKKFTEKYKVGLNSKVVISFADNEGESFSAAFRICGIYVTNNPSVDETKLYVRSANLHDMCVLPTDSIHELAIRLASNDELLCSTVQKQVAVFLNEGEIVRPWTEINPIVGLYNGLMGVMFMIVILLILLALGFGIVNTVLMSVMERRRELTMLMAIGMNRCKVMTMIITESTVLTLLGGLVGLLLGLLSIYASSKTGIDMSSNLGSYSAIGIAPIIYPAIGLLQCIQIIIMVTLTGIVAAIYPARVAVKSKAAEVTRQ
jgi:ABC-type lipoprotein release transport system permease subunit